MLYLWIFGDNVEDRMGHGRFLVFYLLCGIAAALVAPAVALAFGWRWSLLLSAVLVSCAVVMMQRGRQIICGNVGPGLGDSMYDGEIYVAGTVKSLGIDCVPGEWTEADTEFIERKFRIYGLGSPPEFQKFVCGKMLYNYDTLEPAERKLVL